MRTRDNNYEIISSDLNHKINRKAMLDTGACRCSIGGKVSRYFIGTYPY